MSHCPLCGAAPTRLFHAGAERDFRECPRCALVHVAPAHRPPPLAETLRYLAHAADPTDAGHRAFLTPVVDALAARLAPGARGLDYGAGPAPTLARLLEERGFAVRAYDPLFAPDDSAIAPGARYDFVTCTEALEHFHHPAAELERLAALLRPGGWLAISTALLEPAIDFATWWYRRDATHVCFFRRATLAWIAGWRRWTLELVEGEGAGRVALFRA